MILFDGADASEGARPRPGRKLSPEEAMRLAVLEARRGFGRVSPNPPVGCVILDKNQRFLAAGFHRAFGQNHAEADALQKIKDKGLLKGASLYVTLEPCARQGKTPSCANLLIQYPLKTVFYGQKDPHPETDGKGLKKLQANGVPTRAFSSCQKDIQRLYEPFAFHLKNQRAFVSLKIACSLDGMAAFQNGESQWITGPEARKQVAVLRAFHDAVLVGKGAFLQDNPRLNARLPLFRSVTNKAIVLDPSGESAARIPGSRLASVRKMQDIILIVRKSQRTCGRRTFARGRGKAPFHIMEIPFLKGGKSFDLSKLTERLYREFNICSLLVEGGPGVFSAFAEQKRFQRLYQFTGPLIMGGKRGRSWAEALLVRKIKPSLCDMECRMTGESVLITARGNPPDPSCLSGGETS